MENRNYYEIKENYNYCILCQLLRFSKAYSNLNSIFSLKLFKNSDKLDVILDKFSREIRHNLSYAITTKGEKDGNNFKYLYTITYHHRYKIT